MSSDARIVSGTVTVDASGDAVVYFAPDGIDGTGVFNGRIAAFSYTPDDYDAGGTFTLEGEKSGLTLCATGTGAPIDSAWSVQPKATVITPSMTVEKIAPTWDTYANANAPATNYKTGVAVYVGRGPTAATLYHGFWSIPLSGLTGATITSAVHHIYCVNDLTATSAATIYRVLVAATADLTWNTYDGTHTWPGDVGADGGADAGCTLAETDYTATHAVAFTIPDAPGWTNITITDMVQDVITASGTSIIAMARRDAEDSSNAGQYASSDNATAANRPYSTITFYPQVSPVTATIPLVRERAKLTLAGCGNTTSGTWQLAVVPF
jgi:hypothetical protein